MLVLHVRCTSMFIVVLMWLLAAFMLVAAIDFTIVRPRADRDEVTATAVALLFALRGLRAGVPDVVGSLIDVYGFYWNMVMVGVAALLFLAKFVGDYSRSLKAWAAALPGRQLAAEQRKCQRVGCCLTASTQVVTAPAAHELLRFVLWVVC